MASYWSPLLTLTTVPSRDMTALTNRGLMYLFTQISKWNLSISSFLPVSLDVIQCSFQLALRVCVPVVLSRVLSYLGQVIHLLYIYYKCIIHKCIYYTFIILYLIILTWYIIYRLASLSYWVAFGGSIFTLFPILVQVFYANYSIWLLFGAHALAQVSLHWFDHRVAWVVSLHTRKGASVVRFDVRYITVYIVYPIMLWLLSLILGCYQTIPQSRGLKLHYQSKSTWEIVSTCFSQVFWEQKC